MIIFKKIFFEGIHCLDIQVYSIHTCNSSKYCVKFNSLNLYFKDVYTEISNLQLRVGHIELGGNYSPLEEYSQKSKMI